MFSLTRQFYFNVFFFFCILSAALLQCLAAVSLGASTGIVSGKTLAICFVEYICYNVILLFPLLLSAKRGSSLIIRGEADAFGLLYVLV